MRVEKFPKIDVGRSRLIWDSRQEHAKAEILVLLEKNIGEDEIFEQLITRDGVCKIVASKRWREKLSATLLEVEYVESAEAWLANSSAQYYGEPSKNLSVIGVTGTNGKSSIVDIIGQGLCRSGKKVLVIGTLGVRVFDPDFSESEPAVKIKMGFTTPESPTLQNLLAQCLEDGITHVAMEVSSHAVELSRAQAVDFDVAVFSNLSQDHLDFHGNMTNYLLAKAKLFNVLLKNSSKANRKAVLGFPDRASQEIENVLSLPDSIEQSFIRPADLKVTSQTTKGMSFSYLEESYSSPLIGEFNAWNLSLSLEVLKFFGTPAKDLKKFVSEVNGISGRLERCAPNVFVDFAHTPEALRGVLIALRSIAPNNAKIICVFGCGGNRDRQKRPLMGAIASKFADKIIVTNDNPRREIPADIAKDIVVGIQGFVDGDSKLKIELDRKAAIELALKEKKPNDIVLIAGKGHEDYQIVGDLSIPFSDQKVVRNYFSSKSK